MVQLYLTGPTISFDKPKSELKAFSKTRELKPGESEVITLKLAPKDLASFNTSKSSWIADKGNYTIGIGASVLDIKLSTNFMLLNDLVVEKVNPVFPPDLKFEDLKP